MLLAGHLQRFCDDYGIDDIRFDEFHIEVIHDAAGNELSDIRTPEHNAAAADCITDLIRRLTQDPTTALHVSLAGGRKTMGYYIGYALSLFGRAQDQLSHVLVSEEFETELGFFYPSKDSRVLETRNKGYLDTSKARIDLARIPFVRLRDTLPPRLLAERISFNEAVHWSNLDKTPVELKIDLAARSFQASGESVTMVPKLLAFYTAFARAAQEGEGYFAATGRNLQLTRAFAEERARCHAISVAEGEPLPELLERLDDAGVDPRTVQSLRGANKARDGTSDGRITGIGKKYIEPLIPI